MAHQTRENEMQIKTQEHYDIIAMFEKLGLGVRYEKEAKELWQKGHVFQHGETNNLFLAFRHGVAFGKALER